MPIAVSIRTSKPRTRSRRRRSIAARWSAFRSATSAACAWKCARSRPTQTRTWCCTRSSKPDSTATPSKIKNLRQAERYLPDNIYDAIDNFRKAEWTTTLLGEDVKGRYADLKQASADRCPRSLGTFVKAPEVQFHHEVYNQFLWNLF